MEGIMLRWLSPGDIVSDVAGLPKQSEHRMVLRMFVNIIVWGAIGTAVAFAIAL